MACVVPYCRSYPRLTAKTGERIGFHRFPENNVQQKCIDAVGRNNWTLKKYDRICSKHFKSDCFVIIKNRRHLLPDAIPTVFQRPLELLRWKAINDCLVTCALEGRDVLSSKMPTLRTITHIALLCVTSVYLSTVEGLNILTQDASHSDFDQEDGTLQLLKDHQPDQRYKQNQIDIKSLGKLLEQIPDNVKHKRYLREDSIGSVKDFLSKLNSYINKDKHNNDYKKRDNCRAFGRPGSICKKNKFRRNLSFGNFDQSRKGKEDNMNYGQHMLVERARYRSSSESSSDEDRPRQKSRFQIVDNAKYKKNSRGRHKGSSEEDYGTLQMEYTDDSDEQSDEPERNTNDDDAKSDEPQKEVSELSDESDEKSVEQETDEKVFYLQGSRLQKPNFKSRYIKKNRRSFREPGFMPKRYKWDDNMLTHLDEYWTMGIKSYDTYRTKYQKLWPYRYYK